MTTTAQPVAIVIGTRINCILHYCGPGIVFAIETPPETITRPHVVMHRPKGPTFDVVFDNGSISKGLSEGLIRGVQWRILPEVATPEQIAAALANAACRKASAQVAAENEASRHAAAVDQLRNDPAHARLEQAGNGFDGGKTAAKNIRTELKAAFPGVKFSVRNRDHGALNVDWTDGPTVAAVEAITGKYKGGRFNGMEDIYEDEKSPWCDVFGRARYLFTHRDFSADLITRAIVAVFERYAGNLKGEPVPTAEDYQTGRLYARRIPHLGGPLDQLDVAVRAQASEMEA